MKQDSQIVAQTFQFVSRVAHSVRLCTYVAQTFQFVSISNSQ